VCDGETIVGALGYGCLHLHEALGRSSRDACLSIARKAFVESLDLLTASANISIVHTSLVPSN
jgi:hypothetical protein